MRGVAPVKHIKDCVTMFTKRQQGLTTALRSQMKRGYEPDARAILPEPRVVKSNFLSVLTEESDAT